MYSKKVLRAILLFFFLSNSAWAGNLCDASCTLTIDFPSGGSIKAVEDLTITFGTSGLVDTVSSVTAYINGESLTLNSGESLVFENGGRFDIGSTGNIDFTNLAIITDGTIGLKTTGGNETVIVSSGDTLSVFGDANLSINTSVISIPGSIEISAGGQFSLYNNFSLGCLFSNTSGSDISISNFTVTVTSDNFACASILSQATITEVNSDDTTTISDDESSETETNQSDSGAMSLFYLFVLLTLLVIKGFSKKLVQ